MVAVATRASRCRWAFAVPVMTVIIIIIIAVIAVVVVDGGA
jgi:hypothetical protein